MKRFTMPRYIPDDSVEEIHEDIGFVFYLYGKDRLCCICYKGKSKKPYFHYNFLSEEKRRARIDETVVDHKRYKQEEEELKKIQSVELQNFARSVKVGDIFVSSWGYDQTNVDFYQVIEKKNVTVVVKEVQSSTVEETGYDSSRVIAVKNKFINDIKLTKRISKYKSLKISDCQTAHKWDGTPCYSS